MKQQVNMVLTGFTGCVFLWLQHNLLPYRALSDEHTICKG